MEPRLNVRRKWATSRQAINSPTGSQILLDYGKNLTLPYITKCYT